MAWPANHNAALTRVLRSINGSRKRRLIFAAGAPMHLEAWADASLGADLQPGMPHLCKSRSGVLITVGGTVLTAKSRRIVAACLSTWESEISALSLVLRLLFPIRDTITILLAACAPILPRPTAPPTTVHCDNTAVISTILRGHIAGRARHIRIDISFIFDAVLSRDIRLAYCRSLEMRAGPTS